MGLLDQVTQLAGGFLGNDQQSSVLKTLTGFISQQSGSGGGLTALIQGFEKNGLGQIITSWVSTGKNLPVNAEQIQKGLGSDVLQQIAAKTGLSPDQVSSHLTEVLPNLVDKLTPTGQVPEGNALNEMLTLLQSKLK